MNEVRKRLNLLSLLAIGFFSVAAHSKCFAPASCTERKGKKVEVLFVGETNHNSSAIETVRERLRAGAEANRFYMLGEVGKDGGNPYTKEYPGSFSGMEAEGYSLQASYQSMNNYLELDSRSQNDQAKLIKNLLELLQLLPNDQLIENSLRNYFTSKVIAPNKLMLLQMAVSEAKRKKGQGGNLTSTEYSDIYFQLLGFTVPELQDLIKNQHAAMVTSYNANFLECLQPHAKLYAFPVKTKLADFSSHQVFNADKGEFESKKGAAGFDQQGWTARARDVEFALRVVDQICKHPERDFFVVMAGSGHRRLIDLAKSIGRNSGIELDFKEAYLNEPANIEALTKFAKSGDRILVQNLTVGQPKPESPLLAPQGLQ